MSKCEICGKPAIGNCSQCGMSLCKEHIQHGIQFRTNQPVINCPNCKKNIGKLSQKLIILFTLIFIIIIITTIFVLNSIFSFL
jgi:uncharacterized membrane protein YvbJ